MPVAHCLALTTSGGALDFANSSGRTEQPLGIPVDLKDAGHYLLSQPVYLCPRGDLWITHAGAAPTDQVIARAPGSV